MLRQWRWGAEEAEGVTQTVSRVHVSDKYLFSSHEIISSVGFCTDLE